MPLPSLSWLLSDSPEPARGLGGQVLVLAISSSLTPWASLPDRTVNRISLQ